MRRNRWTGAVAATAVMAVLLGGCSDDGDKPKADASASADVPTGDPTVETSDGGEVVTGGEVNEAFPDKKVPLIGGTVLSSASSPDGGFSVIILVDGEPAAASKKAVDRLKRAGFEVKSKEKSGGAVVTVLRSPKYKVEVAATPSGTQTSVNYVVTKR